MLILLGGEVLPHSLLECDSCVKNQNFIVENLLLNVIVACLSWFNNRNWNEMYVRCVHALHIIFHPLLCYAGRFQSDVFICWPCSS